MKADERDELPRRKRGNCPAATVRPLGPAVGWAVFKLVTTRQWVLTTWSSDGLTTGLGGSREKQWEGEMDSRKMLMISGHCRVTGLSAMHMSCNAQKAVST